MTTEATPGNVRLTDRFGQLPDAEWLAGDGSQAWRAATVLAWPTLNARRYTTPLFTAEQLRATVAAERERCCRVVAAHRDDDRYGTARSTILAIRAGDHFHDVDDEVLRA